MAPRRNPAPLRRVRILHISDTHGLHRSVEETFPMPEADILIHTGDLTDVGTPEQFEDFNAWLGDLAQRYPQRLVIFGNHDYYTLACGTEDPARVLDPQFLKRLLPNATVLEHEGIELMGLRIFGSAWCPWHTANAPGDEVCTSAAAGELFRLWQAGGDRRGSAKAAAPRPLHRFGELPVGMDVLLTHGPPQGVLDCCELGGLQWGGSQALLKAILLVRPRAHLFGHIHEQRGFWHHAPGEDFRGGVEYDIGKGKLHPTWPAPAADYPCELISCNAMLSHAMVDQSRGNPRRTCIAGPARLIIAEGSGEPGAAWRFTVPEG